VLRFTFIIPTYNAERHLDVCLKSIREQDFPQDHVAILLADGGSEDTTVAIGERYNCRILENKKKLAEFGVQLGMREASSELVVVFAADNELVGRNWLRKVEAIFRADEGLSALWGRLASGARDPFLNKYFALIQSDPLNWFLNNNLDVYKKEAVAMLLDVLKFKVRPDRPLVWGANGLVFRASKIKPIWARESYLGDNDAFQTMVEQGDNEVVYFTSPFVFHHHVARLADWVRKWRRNFMLHFLDKKKTRNMNWVFAGNFKVKLFLWIFYAGVPIFSLLHSLYLSLRDRNAFWLLHPLASFLQLVSYVALVLGTGQGRAFLKETLFG
jgi:glycosyltransferase involved in cell wall biosynthesis